MGEYCMYCKKAIVGMERLSARRCKKALESERNPFTIPVDISEPVHESPYICSECAKKNNVCPYCSGELIPTELMMAINEAVTIIKEEGIRSNFSGEFRAAVITDDSINVSYITSSGLSNEPFLLER